MRTSEVGTTVSLEQTGSDSEGLTWGGEDRAPEDEAPPPVQPFPRVAPPLPDELLEEVRLLANIDTPTEKVFPVVLVGQPDVAHPVEDALEAHPALGARERTAGDFPVVSVAVGYALDAGRIRQARLVLGGVAPVPWRSAVAEAVLEKFGGDSVGETRRNVESYLDTLRFR